MNALGIFTGRDLRDRELPFLQAQFGKAGPYYHWIARGVDHRPVRPDREHKSVGAETTFSSDLTEFDAMVLELRPLVEKVWRYCSTNGIRGRTVTLKVKWAAFTLVTRSRSGSPVAGEADLSRLTIELLRALFPLPQPVRLLGVTLSALSGETLTLEPQLDLSL